MNNRDPTVEGAGVLGTDPFVTFVGGDGDSNQTIYQNRPDLNINPEFQCNTFASMTLGCNCTVNKGPFADWQTIRQFGVAKDHLPLQRSLACFNQWRGDHYTSVGLPQPELVANWTTIQSFTQTIPKQIEWHSPPHSFWGYTMILGSSPSDPTFFFYHSWYGTPTTVRQFISSLSSCMTTIGLI